MLIKLKASRLAEIADMMVRNIDHSRALFIAAEIERLKKKTKLFFKTPVYASYTEAMQAISTDVWEEEEMMFQRQRKDLVKWQNKIEFLRGSNNLIDDKVKGLCIQVDSEDESLWCFNFY